MKTFIVAGAAVSVASVATAASAVAPIKGSITYERPDSVRLTKAPAGIPVSHQFYADGNKYKESYVVQSNGSLKLLSRWKASDS